MPYPAGKYVWCTDGISEIKIQKDDSLPSGFRYGRSAAVKKKIQTQVNLTVVSRTEEEKKAISNKVKEGLNRISPE